MEGWQPIGIDSFINQYQGIKGMIARYTLPEMGKIWEDENKFSIWLQIEIYATEALSELGIVPKNALKNIKERAKFDIDRILEIENEVHHDVIAFLTNVAEHVGEDARFLHYGMTSSDILDTALAVQMVQAAKLIREELIKLIEILKERAKENKNVVMIGRTHGIHAEPITFGLKLALWFDEIRRQLVRLDAAISNIAVGQISGAVGTYDHISPHVQDYVCEKLGLQSANISNQVLQRDPHAHYLNTLALIGCSLEKIATEIRHLQKTEVLEAEEYFSKGQKGSSSMPHKKNPIICERISGMARLLRGYAVAGMENIALWHERDISHSSVERVILPDATITLYYMLRKTCDLIRQLVIHPEKMRENLNLTKGLIFSQSLLLNLAQKGLSREKAYKMVQRNALKVWQDKVSFKDALLKDKEIEKYISPDEINDIFSIDSSLKNVDYIFNKVGIE
jgi:adenylosuccinate lyase